MSKAYDMKTVYALYHSARTMPLGMFDTEALAFKALNHYSALSFSERRAFSVVACPVHNNLSW
jgi:hypothetical protein